MGCCRCRILPHGRISVYALMMGIATHLFAVSSLYGCYFIEANASLSSDYPEILLRGVNAGFGLFSYEDAASLNNNGKEGDFWACYSYEPDQVNQFDAMFKMARVFGLMANILIGISVLLLLPLTCLPYKQSALHGIVGMLILGGITQALTFVFFASNFCDKFQCQFYAGSGAAVAASFCSFLTAFMVLGLPNATISDPYNAGSNGSSASNSLGKQPSEQNPRRDRALKSPSASDTASSVQKSRRAMTTSSDAGSGAYRTASSEGSRRHRRSSLRDDYYDDLGSTTSSWSGREREREQQGLV